MIDIVINMQKAPDLTSKVETYMAIAITMFSKNWITKAQLTHLLKRVIENPKLSTDAAWTAESFLFGLGEL